MVGDGPDRVKAESLSRKLGINKQVEFLGKLKVIEKILSISDIFLLPSSTESFGLVALEAMASKTAIISTNTGGLPEVNIDGYTGFLSNLGDIDKMANDTLYLLNNKNILSEFKANAFTHSKTFDIINILPKYKSIYYKLSYKNL